MTGPHDHPWEEVVKSADRAIAKGGTVFFKWSCQKCGSRQTFDVPDTFYKTGRCEECGAITDLTEHGCNFMVVY